MKHLLIIEDDKVDQMAFERFAKTAEFPYTYTLVSSLKETYKALKKEKFDAIVSDYFLGDGTSFEILALNLKMPFIITTGTGSEEIAVKAMQKGAYDYLIKDIDGFYLKILPITIENALHRFESEKKLQGYQTNLEKIILERTSELQLEISKSKELENTLRQERDKFDFILQSLPIGVSVLDTDNNFTYISKKSIKLDGYQTHKQDILKKHILSIHPKNKKTKIESLIKSFASGKKSVVIREAKRNKKILEIAYHTIRDNQNKYRGVLRLVSNITDRKRDELIKEVIYNITKKANAVKSLKALFSFIRLELAKIIDTSNFFIALYDKNTDMISTPYMVDEQDDGVDFPKGKTLTGYVMDTKKTLCATESELLALKNRKVVEILGPMSKCWIGVPLIVEKETIGALVIQSYTNVKAYSKKDVALLELVALNISQVIKQSQDFEKINLLNQALIQSDGAVIITNLDGTIQYVNPAFKKLSGYSQKEVIGENPRILKSGEQPLEYYEKLWNTILSGKTWNGEFINKRKDGSKYLVQANISPVKNNDGKITHFIGVEEDITEKRQLERDFIHAFIDAQEQEKQSFGEDLHDGISQVLAAEAMYIDVLVRLDKKDDKKTTNFLTKIRELNLKATNDARNLAHGLMSKQLKEDGLLKAIDHICIDYSHSRSIDFEFTHKGLKEAEFNKDLKTNIFRIIQEVSTNTIRHSLAKKASVELTRENKNHLKLVIKDDGVGIDFDKMKRENKGAGLKNIENRVILLRGSLILDSALNQGTKYTIVVPLKNIK